MLLLMLLMTSVRWLEDAPLPDAGSADSGSEQPCNPISPEYSPIPQQTNQTLLSYNQIQKNQQNFSAENQYCIEFRIFNLY